MDFKVFLSEEALSDLEQVIAYIAPHDPDAAARMGNRLLDTAFSLGSFPERGRVVPEFKRKELRETVLLSYRIIYRVNKVESTVEIVRFWHAARGFPHIPTF